MNETNDTGLQEAFEAPSTVPSKDLTGQPQEPVQGPAEDSGSVDVFDPDVEAAFQSVIEPLDQGAYDQAVNGTISAVVRSDSLQETASLLAMQSGLPLEAAHAVIVEAATMHRNTVDRALHRSGLVTERDRESFYSHLRQQPQKLQHAVNSLVRGRDVSVFQSMASEWQAVDLSSHLIAGRRMRSTVPFRIGRHHWYAEGHNHALMGNESGHLIPLGNKPGEFNLN